mgnify:CR=1 FL=1
MTRADEIRHLQARYLVAAAEGKRNTASLIYARLRSLMTRQVKAEIREEKRA